MKISANKCIKIAALTAVLFLAVACAEETKRADAQPGDPLAPAAPVLASEQQTAVPTPAYGTSPHPHYNFPPIRVGIH